MDIFVPLDPDPGRSRGYSAANNHFGIDYEVNVGTPILVSAAGVVSRIADEPDGYGNLVTINHADGFSTRYAHLSRIDVSVGQQLAAREVIGLTGGARGAPGAGNSTGPHLHYEVRINNEPVNPDDHFTSLAAVPVALATDVLYRAANDATDRTTGITKDSIWTNVGTRFLRVDAPPAGVAILDIPGNDIAAVRAEQAEILNAAHKVLA